MYKKLAKQDEKLHENIERYHRTMTFLHDKKFIKEVHNSLATLVFLLFGDKYDNTPEFDEHIETFFECVHKRERMFQIVYFHGELGHTYF